jgi:hypothetical protein
MSFLRYARESSELGESPTSHTPATGGIAARKRVSYASCALDTFAVVLRPRDGFPVSLRSAKMTVSMSFRVQGRKPWNRGTERPENAPRFQRGRVGACDHPRQSLAVTTVNLQKSA